MLKSYTFSMALVPMMLWAGGSVAEPMYPEVSRATTVNPIARPCTQLEMAAGIDGELCGTLPLPEVARAKFDLDSDDNDDN
jgi:hypothetical protein